MIILLGNKSNPALDSFSRALRSKGNEHMIVSSFADIDVTLELSPGEETLQCSLGIDGHDLSRGHSILNWIEYDFFDTPDGSEYASMEKYATFWAYLANTPNLVVNRPSRQGFRIDLNPLIFNNVGDSLRIRSLSRAAEDGDHAPNISSGRIETAIYWDGQFYGSDLEETMREHLKAEFKQNALLFAAVYLYVSERKTQVLACHRLTHFELPPEVTSCIVRTLEGA